MNNDEKIETLTATVEKLEAQMQSLLDIVGTRANYEESSTSIDVEGTTMTLAEYEIYIRKLELDNRYREAKRLEQLAKIANGNSDE